MKAIKILMIWKKFKIKCLKWFLNIKKNYPMHMKRNIRILKSKLTNKKNYSKNKVFLILIF